MEQEIKLGSFFKDKYLWLTLLIGGFFLSLTLWYSFGMDQSFFSYAAWCWKRSHSLPYTGIWYHDLPGIFVIHTFASYLFGDSMFSFRFFDFLVQLGNLALIYYLAGRLAENRTARFLAGLAYSIWYFGFGIFDTGQREGFLLFFLLASTILSFRLKPKVWLRAVLVGLILGFAFLVKTVYGLIGANFALLFLIEGFRKRPKRVWPELALFALALALPSLITVLICWRADALKPMYEASVWYNYAVYAKLKYPLRYYNRGLWLLLIPKGIFLEQPIIFLLGSLGILSYLASRQPGTERNKLVMFLLSLLAVSLLLYLYQDKRARYHLIPFMGIMNIFCGVGLARLGAIIGNSAPRQRPFFSRTVFYFLVIIMLLAGYPEQILYAFRYAFGSLDRAYSAGLQLPADRVIALDQYQAAKGISTFLAPNDTIGFFGMYPLIPFLLKKPLPTRFCSVQQMIYRPVNGRITLTQLRWREEYVNAIIKARPNFFILADQEIGLPTDLPSQRFKDALGQDFPELNDFLNQNYELAARFGHTELYRKRR